MRASGKAWVSHKHDAGARQKAQQDRFLVTMSSSDSELDRLQAMAEIIPDYLRRILPLARPSEDVPQHTTLHAAAECASSTRATLSHQAESTTKGIEAREEAAEDLCDLVASASYAQIAVRCMAFQMLAVVAMEALDTGQYRLAELCMAALANLTCHEKLAEQAAQQQNVRQAVIKFLLTATDKGCLSEVLRFLHTAVKGPSSSVWLGLVSDDSEPALARIVWMTDNTLDRVLLERCLEFLLAACHAHQQLLPTFIDAGIMPILVNVLTAYTGVAEADAAENSVWRPSADLGGAYESDCDSAGEPTPNSRPSGAAVVACLSLLQLLIEDTSDQRVKGHLSPISSMLLQLLQVHEFLHNRGVVLGEVVVLLACLDSSLWAAQLADNVTALEAVLVVLIGDLGFDLIESQEAVQQGQEAGWAVLAALSKHLVQHQPSQQVLLCLAAHSQTFTASEIREQFEQYAPYTITNLLRAVSKFLENRQQVKDDSEAHHILVAFKGELQGAQQ